MTHRARTEGRVMKGRRMCDHICNDSPCLNKNKEVEWKREGGSLVRHEKKLTLHINCSPECPGYSKIYTTSTTADQAAQDAALGQS